MPALRRHVLLSLKDYRRDLHEAVAAYAATAGWQVEYCGAQFRRGWCGDGVITDHPTPEDLERLADPDGTPLVVRNHLQGPRIRHVHGDVAAIARLAVEHFRERGYGHLIAADALPWIEDPAVAFIAAARADGLTTDLLHWGDAVTWDDHGQAMAHLVPWLQRQPKSCGLFVPSLWALGLVVRACQEARIRIPDEVAVLVNNDDPVQCEGFTPTISSIDGQIRRFGWVMAERLDALMAGKPVDPAPVLIGPDRIISRQSTDMLAVPHGPTAQALAYLRRHLGEPIGVADLAAAAGVSVTTLEERFRRHFGVLPLAMLVRERLTLAQHLLATTDLGLAAIAGRTGYGSASALLAAFTRHLGETPGAWRRRHTRPVAPVRTDAPPNLPG